MPADDDAGNARMLLVVEVTLVVQTMSLALFFHRCSDTYLVVVVVRARGNCTNPKTFVEVSYESTSTSHSRDTLYVDHPILLRLYNTP